jgi:alpha-tubulin suppressor-like RCC1 family protein
VQGGLQLTAISAGASTTCGVATTSAGYCWGAGFGVAPRLFLPGMKLRSISVSPSARVCAVDELGEVFCAGQYQYGQAGDDDPSATAIHRLRSDIAFVDVRAASTFTCGLAATGAAYCWGDNGAGELGARSLPSACNAGGSYPCTSQPVRVGSRD